MASPVSVPHDFINGTPSVADNVDANFNAIVGWINSNAAHLDGSKAFTGPVGGVTPVASGHLTPKSYVDNAIASASRVMGYAEQVNSQGLTTTPTTIAFGGTDLAVSFTAVAGRRYKVTASGNFTHSSNIDAKAVLEILQNGSAKRAGGAWVDASAYGTELTVTAVLTPGAGSVTYKVRGWVSAGSGTLAVDGATPAYILVEDIGT